MKLFTAKSLVLAVFMFILVLAGMQAANDGISRTKGYDDPDFKQAVSIIKDNGVTEVAIMGGEVTQESLESKTKQMGESDAYNVFSSMGKGIATAISGLARAIVGMFSS